MKAVNRTSERRLATIIAPHAGLIVGERYRLEEWLESGAMGSVWRAEQIRLRSTAAVKFLDPSLFEVPEMLERFLQEARLAAAVQSAHVVQVFDYGSEGGLPYIAMEFLEGESLEARLATRGMLTPVELDKVFSEVARGLGQAHELGVIHRDVKPGNIFLAREGRHEVTKLIDFGIAKVKADALRVSRVVGTQLGMMLGTPQYMSPEQMRGRGTLDYRTDLWALAIIACECLTGRHAFSGTTLGDLSVQICMENPLAPSTLGEVPAGFDQWFFKATSKEPNERFASAADMADALTEILVPSKHAPAGVRDSPRPAEPSAGEMSRARSAGFWSTSSHIIRRARLTFERAFALGMTSIVRLRTSPGNIGPAVITGSAVVVSRSLRRPRARRSWSSVGAVGLVLMVVACGLLLLQRLRGSPTPNIQTNVASHALSQPISGPVVAVGPIPPTPAIHPPVARASDPVTTTSVPVQEPANRSAVRATKARSAPAKASKAGRRGRRRSPPANSNSSAQAPMSLAPLNPMSEGMRRVGALISQDGDKRRPVRLENPAPDRARDRAGPKPE
jgi:hypothetical protein